MNCYEFVKEEARRRYGIEVPPLKVIRKSVDRIGKPRAGDLVAIRRGRNVVHVGLMIDGKRMIHYEKENGAVVQLVDNTFLRHKVEGFYRCRQR